METKTRYSRLTIDIPNEDHRRLKSGAATLGKSMRELVCEALHSYLLCTPDRPSIPNEETLQAMENVENGKELVVCNDVEDMFHKLEA